MTSTLTPTLTPTEREQAQEADTTVEQAIRYRPATLHDELHLTTLVSKMLRELEPLGHDILPTDRNVDTLVRDLFLPAIHAGRHGLVLAFTGGVCMGASFFTPEESAFDTPPGRAVAWGIYVLPAWREMGVACRLQEHAHRLLHKSGYTTLVTTLLANNPAGMALNRAGGGTITSFYTTTNLTGGH